MGLVKSVKQYLGVLAISPPDTIVAERAPTVTDTHYRLFQIWLNDDTGDFYIYSGAGVWAAFAGSGIGIATINTQPPLVNNFTLAGTASQITATTTAHTVTFSLPAAITAPGSLTTTSTLASGTTLTAGTSATVTTSLLVGTTITATAGAITATNGNFVFGTAGNKIISTSVGTTTAAGANSFGSVTLVGGTATVATTAVTANSLIFLSRQSLGATGAAAIGMLSVGTITANTSFVINAATTASATTPVASDVSVVSWMIVN